MNFLYNVISFLFFYVIMKLSRHRCLLVYFLNLWYVAIAYIILCCFFFFFHVPLLFLFPSLTLINFPSIWSVVPPSLLLYLSICISLSLYLSLSISLSLYLPLSHSLSISLSLSLALSLHLFFPVSLPSHHDPWTGGWHEEFCSWSVECSSILCSPIHRKSHRGWKSSRFWSEL